MVLVRAGEHSTGLVADELIGSREIVVKSVGPQISGIRGISGATILGDGRIVIILDISALVRAEWRARAQPLAPREKGDRRIFAMVVDDSITVRRVTQRLLERNGMRVLTARDGMDAVALLQDNVPDVILLDIEMPRMDGYEVAAHVRNDPRLKDVPIIMVTSRVGEKHRARAIELGVDDYLGKPYQEAQLLDAIAPLVERRRARAQPAPPGAEAVMAERVAEIYSLLIPLVEAGCIIPRACVAEVIGFQAPVGDDRGAAVVHRHRALERQDGAAGVLRGRLRADDPAGLWPHPHRHPACARHPRGGRQLRPREPGVPAAGARELGCGAAG